MTDMRPRPADRPLRVVIAPDSFKGSLSAARVAAALATGWRMVRPGDELVELPIADGGEGTLDVFAAAVDGAVRRCASVTGPDGRSVDADWLLLPDGTAVVELARASGLPLLAAPDPLGAHTVGLGQLLAAALDAGSRQIIVALGGSASTDGGTGALAALGARFLDGAGHPLTPGGGRLGDLAAVDTARLRPAPPDGVLCLVDVDAPLLGPRGAAAVFGPQKGATAGDVAVLAVGLARLAALLGGVPGAPGAGSAGGTGYGLAAGWGARLVPGADTVATRAGLPAKLAAADVVLTGEGRFDATSLSGKVVGGVLRLAEAAAAARGARGEAVRGAGDGDGPGPARGAGHAARLRLGPGRGTAVGGLSVLLVAGQLAHPAPAGVRGAVGLADVAGGVPAALAEPEHWLAVAGARLAAQTTPDPDPDPDQDQDPDQDPDPAVPARTRLASPPSRPPTEPPPTAGRGSAGGVG